MLAIDLEGNEVCDWLTAAGITCVLLKYRVPSEPYDWHCDCRPRNLMVPKQALDDAQRAMGLVRLHAAEWHIDPRKVRRARLLRGRLSSSPKSARTSSGAYTNPIDGRR